MAFVFVSPESAKVTPLSSMYSVHSNVKCLVGLVKVVGEYHTTLAVFKHNTKQERSFLALASAALLNSLTLLSHEVLTVGLNLYFKNR